MSSGVHALPLAGPAALEGRLTRLTHDKSLLELMVLLMGRLSGVTEVEALVRDLLFGLMDVVGGSNVTLAWRGPQGWEVADVLGRRERVAHLGAPDLEEAMANRVPRQQAAEDGSAAGGGFTWVVPLLVGSEVVGAMRLEGCQLTVHEFQQHLRTVFAHAALVLRNAVAAEHQLEQAHAQVRDEVSARGRALQASEAKSQFLANVSHELRTPLNGVVGMAQLLRTTSLSDEQRGYLELLELSSHSLLGVINDVLDLSKIEAGHLELSLGPVSLRQAMAQTLEAQRSRLQARGLGCFAEVAPDVAGAHLADGLRLGQVLLNLVGNAIKFTERGQVGIRAEVVPGTPTSQRLRVSVVDTGPGIPAEALERIFGAFEQADGSITRRHGGTGLGLAISRRLIELMGGRLWAESELGRGSTFTFEVELEPVELPGPQVPLEPLRLGLSRSMAVLVAEDNPINERVVTGLLGKLGARFDVARDGLEAVTLLETHTYDVVLMDVQMPVMDGIEATQRVRAAEAAGRPRTPVVALTAHALAQEQRAFLEAGFDDCLSKPLRLELLVEALERHAGQASLVPSRPAPVAP